MKTTFKQFLAFLSSMVVMTLGWIGSLTFAQTDMSEWHISLPSMIISWAIFIPAYNYWTQFFILLFSKKEENNLKD